RLGADRRQSSEALRLVRAGEVPEERRLARPGASRRSGGGIDVARVLVALPGRGGAAPPDEGARLLVRRREARRRDGAQDQTREPMEEAAPAGMRSHGGILRFRDAGAQRTPADFGAQDGRRKRFPIAARSVARPMTDRRTAPTDSTAHLPAGGQDGSDRRPR